MRRAPWATSTVVIAHVLVSIDHDLSLPSVVHINGEQDLLLFYEYEDDNAQVPGCHRPRAGGH